MKLLSTLLFSLPLICFAQLEGGNAYLMGDLINIAIDGSAGKEGTTEGAGFHKRSGVVEIGDEMVCGFVADPNDTGWDTLLFHGDFFTPGTPENGFGIQIDTVNYSNNFDTTQIAALPGYPIHSDDGGCITVEWRGTVAGVTVKVVYRLKKRALYYTTEITLFNETGEDLTDVYYYRNLDPDNNQSISGGFPTLNIIASQPDLSCEKALDTANQYTPFPSYFGLGAIGPDYRVSTGGFSNRNGEAIWNGLVGLSTEEDSILCDCAVSLAYKTDIANGDSVHFSFAIILSEDGLNEAFGEVYNLGYTTDEGTTSLTYDACSESYTNDTIYFCKGTSVELFVEGDYIGDYDWVWFPDTDLSEVVGESTVATPSEIITYGVTSAESDCFGVPTRYITLNPTLNPAASVSDNVEITLGESTLLVATGGDTYEWYPTDGLGDPTAASTLANPIVTTQYYVVISVDSVECNDTLAVKVYVNPIEDDSIGVSIQEVEASNYRIYPNPFSEFTTLYFDQPLSENYSLVIFDILGEIVYSNDQINGKSVQIKRADLSDGMYILNLIDSNSNLVFSAKLVLE